MKKKWKKRRRAARGWERKIRAEGLNEKHRKMRKLQIVNKELRLERIDRK